MGRRMGRRSPARSIPALAVVLGLTAVACSSTPPAEQPTGAGGMQAVVASVDLYVGAPQRVLVGLPFADGTLVSFGTVGFRFSYTGTAETSMSPQPGPEATATYIPTPGTPDRPGSGPAVTQPSEARGLYQAEGVTFGRAGIWQVLVTADIAGRGAQTAMAVFQVDEEPSLPAPGQPAERTDNLTIHSTGAPRAAIDSRAVEDGKIPDPGLHKWTIAEAVAQHRPALVVFATPVYCVSRFCGPATDLVEKLSKEYADRAVFIHIEIWRDFQKGVINKGAADWLYRNGDLTEPWLYLIGADGRIVDRWGSVFGEREVVSDLQKLPVMK